MGKVASLDGMASKWARARGKGEAHWLVIYRVRKGSGPAVGQLDAAKARADVFQQALASGLQLKDELFQGFDAVGRVQRQGNHFQTQLPPGRLLAHGKPLGVGYAGQVPTVSDRDAGRERDRDGSRKQATVLLLQHAASVAGPRAERICRVGVRQQRVDKRWEPFVVHHGSEAPLPVPRLMRSRPLGGQPLGHT